MGVDERSVDRLRLTLEEHELHGQRGELTLQVLLRAMQMKKVSAEDFELPAELRQHLKVKGELADEQLRFVSQLASHLAHKVDANRQHDGQRVERTSKDKKQAEDQIMEWRAIRKCF